jgi:hypothetical protein
MTSSSEQQKSLQKRTQKSTKTLLFWTLAWVASLALLAFAPKYIRDFNMAFSAMAIVSN